VLGDYVILQLSIFLMKLLVQVIIEHADRTRSAPLRCLFNLLLPAALITQWLKHGSEARYRH
jgi:hypothetical protein